MNAPQILMLAAAAASALSQTACHPGHGTLGTPRYTVGGLIMGIGGAGPVHLVNGSDEITVVGNGTFTMPTPVADDYPYAVTVGRSPPGQNCNVVDGASSVSGTNVTVVYVYCTYKVLDAAQSGT